MRKNLSLLFFLLCFIACKTTRTQTQTSAIPNLELQENDYIAFITYEIVKEDKSYLFYWKGHKLVKGKYKIGDLHSTGKEGDIIIEQLDQNQRLINTMYQESPIEKNVEYVDEKGQLQRKDIALDKAENFCRINLDRKTCFIKISRVASNNDKSNFVLKNICNE